MNDVNYKIIESLVAITEKKNGRDIEFTIKAKNDVALKRLHEVRKFFESDRVYTDVLFYTHADQTYQVIVREESSVPFILGLFKSQLLEQVTWNNLK